MSKEELLQQLGGCWRGDSSEFDGRELQAQLREWADLPDSPKAIAQYQKRWRMCPKGYTHWKEYCENIDDEIEAELAREKELADE